MKRMICQRCPLRMQVKMYRVYIIITGILSSNNKRMNNDSPIGWFCKVCKNVVLDY